MTDACDFPVKVTSITLGNFKNKASLSYIYNSGSQETTYSWAPTEDATDKSYTLEINSGLKDTDLKTITEYTSITTTNSRLMLLPQAIDDDDNIEVSVQYDRAESQSETRKITVPLKNLITTLGERETLLYKHLGFSPGRNHVNIQGGRLDRNLSRYS